MEREVAGAWLRLGVGDPPPSSSPPTGTSYVSDMASSLPRSDAQVVRDVLAGDRDAYRLLVRRYADALHGHALHMVGSQDDATDLVQQTFVQGYRKLDRCRDPERVGAWLFRILANKCRDHLRSPRRRDIPLQALPELPGGRGDPSDAAARAEIRHRLRQALDLLTPEQREAFVMRFLTGLSYAEMAATLNVPVAALKMRVHRAKEALQSLLEEFA